MTRVTTTEQNMTIVRRRSLIRTRLSFKVSPKSLTIKKKKKKIKHEVSCTHCVGVRSVLIRENVRFSVTHQVDLRRDDQSERHVRNVTSQAVVFYTGYYNLTQTKARDYLKVVQEVFAYGVRRTDHHF